jgi:hypothetical protein
MKIAIMQPYFFPYQGYFDLIASVDKFIFLNDVQYVKRRWVNRNIIPAPNKKDNMFVTVPIKKASRNTNINQIEIHDNIWAERHLKTFIHVYGKAKVNSEFKEYYTSLKKHVNLSNMLCESIMWTCKLLGINKKFYYASDYSSSLYGQERILELCNIFKASSYFNAFGGQGLYDKDKFYKSNIELIFMPESKNEKFSILNRILK